MAFKSTLCLIVFIGVCSTALAAEPSIDDTRSTLEKWVETRQVISRTRSEWQADKELLEQQAALFERELKNVADAAAKVDTSSTQVSKERSEAEAAIKSAETALSTAQGFAADFQEQIQKLTPRLPAPLQETLKPLLNRLPSDPTASKMTAPQQHHSHQCWRHARSSSGGEQPGSE